MELISSLNKLHSVIYWGVSTPTFPNQVGGEMLGALFALPEQHQVP